MRYKVSYAFFALKIKKMEDMKMRETVENVTENAPTEKAGKPCFRFWSLRLQTWFWKSSISKCPGHP